MTIEQGRIRAIDLVNGKRRLLEDFRVRIEGEDFVVPAGFEWDGASVPRLFWSSFGHPYDQRHDRPGLFHDACYAGLFASLGMTRERADRIYREWLRALGAPAWQARLEWFAVRSFGRSHWFENEKEKIDEKKVGYGRRRRRRGGRGFRL